MNTRIQTWCAWCGPVFAVVFFVGMLLAGFLPPPSPGDSAPEVADFYRDDVDLIRLGLFTMMIAAGITAPFVAVIAVQLKRIEGQSSPMTYLQLIGGTTGMVAILVPVLIFAAVAFRPERSPEITQVMNDMAWLPFIINIPPAIVQCLSIGMAVLSDRRENPVFPRWVAYYNFWVAFLFVPGGLAMFFKDGAFAWNGLLAFWLAAVMFGTWFVVMSIALRGAIRRSSTDAAVVAVPA